MDYMIDPLSELFVFHSKILSSISYSPKPSYNLNPIIKYIKKLYSKLKIRKGNRLTYKNENYIVPKNDKNMNCF